MQIIFENKNKRSVSRRTNSIGTILHIRRIS